MAAFQFFEECDVDFECFNCCALLSLFFQWESNLCEKLAYFPNFLPNSKTCNN